MKKTLVWSLVIMLGVAFVFLPSVFAAYLTNDGAAQNTSLVVDEDGSSEEELSKRLERILSPEQISNFSNIIKEGKDLFGIRKTNQVQSQNQMKVREQNQDRIIEKISAPQFVNMYEHIRQVGSALWGVKKSDVNNQNIADRLEESGEEMHIQSPSDFSLFKNIRKMIDGKMFGILKDIKEMPEKYATKSIAKFSTISDDEKECVVGLITEKDAAIQANNLKFVEDLNNSIQTRSLCQIEALGKSSDLQKEAVEACISEFKETQEQVREQSKENQESFWSSYKEDMSSCRTQTTSTTPIIIEDGGVNPFK